jgi:hypothetical protein
MSLGMGMCYLSTRTECQITSSRRISRNVLLMRLGMVSSNRMVQSLIVSRVKLMSLASLKPTFPLSRKAQKNLDYDMRAASMMI